jgi:predicted dehydrogenase
MATRWGVIGASGVANRRAMPAINLAEGNELQALMVRDLDRAKKLADEHHAKSYYNSIEAILSDSDVDAVYIATPVYLHCEHVIQSAEHGKHILCEKPMAMNIEECKRMIDACKANNVQLQICFLLRFHPCFQEVKNIISNGEIGEIVETRVSLLKAYEIEEGKWRREPTQSGGGVLMDMGAHGIDLISYILGDTSEIAMMAGFHIKNWEIEETATVLMKMKNGSNAVIDVSFVVPHSETTIEVYGTKGTIIAYNGQGYQEYYLKICIDNNIREEHKPSENLYKNLFVHYNRCLEGEDEPIAYSFAGLNNINLINSAYKSLATKNFIAI